MIVLSKYRLIFRIPPPKNLLEEVMETDEEEKHSSVNDSLKNYQELFNSKSKPMSRFKMTEENALKTDVISFKVKKEK
jgi:hypothetical protein